MVKFIVVVPELNSDAYKDEWDNINNKYVRYMINNICEG